MKTISIQVPDDFKVPEGYEVQIVKKEEKKKKPTIRTYQDLIDNDVEINGYFIGTTSNIIFNNSYASVNNKNVASSEKVAKSMLAMAMISQLMPYYGGEVTDDELVSGSLKFGIIAGKDANNNLTIIRKSIFTMKSFLTFHTQEQRDDFIRYNEQLVKDYLMID